MKNSLIMDLITELGFILPAREPGLRRGVEGNENGGDGDNLKCRSYLATLTCRNYRFSISFAGTPDYF